MPAVKVRNRIGCAMAKRLYEIAKKIGIADDDPKKMKDFIEELRQQGFDVKDHLTKVDEAQEKEIVEYVTKRRTGGVQEKRINSTVRRRRRKVRPQIKKTVPKPVPKAVKPVIPEATKVKPAESVKLVPKVKKATEPVEEQKKEPVVKTESVIEAQKIEKKTVVKQDEEQPHIETKKAEPVSKESSKEAVKVVEDAPKETKEVKVKPQKKEEPRKEPEKNVSKEKTKDKKSVKRKPVHPEMERDERGFPIMKGLRIISKPDEKEVADIAAKRAKERAEKARQELAKAREEALANRKKESSDPRLRKDKGDTNEPAKYGDRKVGKKRKKGRRVIYDKKRDVIAIHDMNGEKIEKFRPTRASLRRKKSKEKKTFAKTRLTVTKAEKRVIKIEGDSIQVGDLAKHMGVKASDVIKKLISMGVMASVTQPVDLDTAEILAAEFEYTIEKTGLDIDATLGLNQEDKPEDLKPRPPVVTVMGHVDHGKTTLLDRIRKSRLVDKEVGQITQHIGAYVLDLPKGRIVWLDTPGHEAFTAMRARGTMATDIVVLVVAADDGVNAQTIEAINHAKDAGVPVIVAINKIDKPTAQPDVVKKQFADYNLIPEEWGGDTVFVNVSAKNGTGVEELLDAILLRAEISELNANPDKRALGVVVESMLDDKKGPLASLLVKEGTLHKGDIIVVGTVHGRVRMMMDDRGRAMKEAGPSIPVQVAGWDAVPQGAEQFYVVPDEKTAKNVISFVKEKKVKTTSKAKKMSLEDLFAMAENGEVKEFKLVLKTDVQGSLDAVKQAINGIKAQKIKPMVIHSGVGEVTGNDINLASAADAVILTFNVGVNVQASRLAKQEKVQVRMYDVIYDLLDDLKKAMQGELKPEINLILSGKAEVRQVFKLSKYGKVAGCMVTEGKVLRGGQVKVIRDGKLINEDTVSALKRFKDDAKEVAQGYECGISLAHFTDYKEGDILEFYRKEEIAQEL